MLACSKLYCDWPVHNQHSWNFSGVHGFLSLTVIYILYTRILNASKHTDKSTDNSVDNKSCNCRQKNSCPLNGNCLQSSVIYQATVKRNDNNTSETYIGLTENAFKTRYRNHTASFHHTKHRNSTELGKHVWSLKDNNIDQLLCFMAYHFI